MIVKSFIDVLAMVKRASQNMNLHVDKEQLGMTNRKLATTKIKLIGAVGRITHPVIQVMDKQIP